MRAVVIAGSDLSGPLGLPSFLDSTADVDLIVLADSGGDHVGALESLGWESVPLILVGDLDSITPTARQQLEARGVEVQLLPTSKDETDLEFALRVACERGADEVVVLAALGGPRLDHLLGTVALLTADWLEGCRVRLVDEAHDVFVARGDGEIRGRPGDLVSLVPLTPVVDDIITEGLAYPLRGDSLRQGSTRGVSNELTSERARVTHGAGELLVIHYRPAANEAEVRKEGGGIDRLACQFSLYPLRQSSIDEAIRAGIEAAARSGAAAGLTVRVQTLSTLMEGPRDAVFEAQRAAFAAAAAFGPVVMVSAITTGAPTADVVHDIQQRHVDAVRLLPDDASTDVI